MRGRGDSSRRLWAAAFVGLLGLALALVLALPSARVPLREPFVPKAARGVAAEIPLEARESRKRTWVHRLTLLVVEPSALRDHDELQLMFASAPFRGGLVRAELRARGTPCLLEAPSGGELADGQPIAFRRAGPCAGLVARTELDLTVELAGESTLALLGFEPLADSAPGPIQVPSGTASGSAYDVRGAFVDYTTPAPRIELLNHMWRIEPSTAWLWLSLAAGIVLAVAGCLTFPTRALASGPLEQTRGVSWPAAGGAALLACSLGVLYAVLVPPLMGPDEPYHMLGLAELTSNRALAEDTVAWMGETHLWRIRYQPTERFRTIDVGRPYVVADDQLRATEVAMRSAILARLWSVVGPTLAGESAPRVLLALRLVNALVFALAVGIAAAFAVAMAPEPYPQWLVFPFLFVPALPFFAMHVSETALLCSMYVLFGTSLSVMFLDGPRAHWSGALLGLATGLMLAGGRSPWPLAPLVAAALLGRVALGAHGTARSDRAATVFWVGFALGGSLYLLAREEAYQTMTNAWAQYNTRAMPAWLRTIGQWLLARPAAVAGLLAGGAVLEVAFRSLRVRTAARRGTTARGLAQKTALGLAWLVGLSLVGSLVLRYPQLPMEPSHPLTALERVTAALATMATMFRLTRANFSLWSSFWVGFGWLDTMPNPTFQALLALPVALAFIALLLHIARHRLVRRLAWGLVLSMGAAASLVLYALATHEMPMALQGRYLIGWYLGVLAVIGTALSLDYSHPRTPALDAGPRSTGATRAALLLALAGGTHLYCLCFILMRYF